MSVNTASALGKISQQATPPFGYSGVHSLRDEKKRPRVLI
jgi:hypothetical protein